MGGSTAWPITTGQTNQSIHKAAGQTHHVERLKDLSLVGGTITIKREGRNLFLLVLLCKSDASAQRDLRSDDTVAAKEAGREDVHRPALAVRHAALAAEQLADDALDRAPAQDGERVAAVRGDDAVLGRDARLETDGDGFL